MNKARILQILAAMLILVGGYILYEALYGSQLDISVLSGIGPLMMGVALLVISKNKAVQ